MFFCEYVCWCAFLYSEAALKSALPEGLPVGVDEEFKESMRPALLVRKSFLALRDNFKRLVDPPMWPSDGKGVFCYCYPVCILVNFYSSLRLS